MIFLQFFLICNSLNFFWFQINKDKRVHGAHTSEQCQPAPGLQHLRVRRRRSEDVQIRLQHWRGNRWDFRFTKFRDFYRERDSYSSLSLFLCWPCVTTFVCFQSRSKDTSDLSTAYASRRTVSCTRAGRRTVHWDYGRPRSARPTDCGVASSRRPRYKRPPPWSITNRRYLPIKAKSEKKQTRSSSDVPRARKRIPRLIIAQRATRGHVSWTKIEERYERADTASRGYTPFFYGPFESLAEILVNNMKTDPALLEHTARESSFPPPSRYAYIRVYTHTYVYIHIHK